MAGNNNNTVLVPTPDPFRLTEMIEESNLAQNDEAEQLQPQNNGEETARNDRNAELIPTQLEQPQTRVRHETDHRDGQTASSSTRSLERPRTHHRQTRDATDARGETDPSTLVILKELQRTNRLIRLQGERIEKLEKRHRHRSPPRRHRRSRSSSSRSPPRRTRRRSPSSSRSPPKRSRRQRSYSRSPLRKSKKNRRPEPAEEESPSPDREERRLARKGRKPRKEEPARRNTHSISPSASDEEEFRSPLSESIRRARLPRGMEKLPTLDAYDGTTDPDDHIRNLEAVMEYHVVHGSIKCRIFPTTLRKGAMTWYRNLPPNSITSWAELKELFLSHFTASRRQPKSEANLEAVVQGTNEPLRDYLDRFNKEAVQVETTDYMKRYLLERGLLPGSELRKAIKIEKMRSMNAILKRAQAFISFEEGEAAAVKASRGNGVTRSSSQDPSSAPRANERKRDDRSRDTKERRGPAGRFNDYTPLKVSREKILAECINAEFRNSNIRPPKPNPSRPGTDKSKYCKYHKSHGHLTDECIHLKDAIETLIKEGHLSKYTKRGDPPRRNDRRSSDEGNSPNARPLQVASSVTRPEDFIPSVGVTSALSV
ncbi:uncharacterized protein LOC131640126 [Vicia villosa]|uniref:uncharacterized protein LOC131640126 n=1 Tax=Vicia villosa TaxID=3911 RepID=UPI00273BA2A5|nr:uncharacterized protein LOC131640126 [Vicia villosa]